MTANWYTMQILPQYQETAEHNLKRQEFEPFFPSLLVRKSKKHEIIQPLFKGYGFVRFDPEVHQWRSINGTRGVIGLVPKFSLLPHPMKPGFVEDLIDNDPVTEIHFNEALDEYYPGLEIKVKDGHFKDRNGTVLRDLGKLLEVYFAWNQTGFRTIIHKGSVAPIEGSD